jgi:hypothetical protein
MNFKQWLIQEMPAKITPVGDFSQSHGFQGADLKIMQSQKAVQKLGIKFNKTPFNLEFYIVNTNQAASVTKANWDNSISQMKQDAVGIGKTVTGEVDPSYLKNLGLNIQINSEVIYVIVTLNESLTNPKQLSSWILAHRLGHGLENNQMLLGMSQNLGKRLEEMILSNFVSDDPQYPEIDERTDRIHSIIWQIILAIGTMKSARTRTLTNRGLVEFMHELLAQYLINGSIAFNPLPKVVNAKDYHGQDRQYTLAKVFDSNFLANELNQQFEQLMSTLKGKVIVI